MMISQVARKKLMMISQVARERSFLPIFLPLHLIHFNTTNQQKINIALYGELSAVGGVEKGLAFGRNAFQP